MSMNLTCNKINLWQTPTYITYMCLETSTPKAALKAYCHWVTDQNIKVMKTKDEMNWADERRQEINDHIKEVELVMNDPDLSVDYI